MAADLVAIENKIKTHVETTSVTVCELGWVDNWTGPIHASLEWIPGDYELYGGGGSGFGIDLEFWVWVRSGSKQNSITAMLEIGRLWYTQAKRDELSALNVKLITPAGFFPPIAYDQGKQVVQAGVRFRLQILDFF